MKNLTTMALAVVFMALSGFVTEGEKLVSNDVHISFYSHTTLEDITANNYKVVSTLDKTTGDVVFSVPMQSFEFEKALMQKHFNSSGFLSTKKFPKAKFKGSISNLSSINFDKDGTYPATATGQLTIKDVTKSIDEKGTIKIEGEKVTISLKMNIVLAEYDITFSKGKPSTNLAKEIELTINAIY
jgi:polyisoprenoid-binding protein YceI